MKKLHLFKLGFVIALLLGSGALLAQIATPFDGDNANIIFEKGEIPEPAGATDLMATDAMLAGADYLQHAQADVTEDNAGNGDPDVDPDDAGWDWRLTSPDFTHTTTASSLNLYGATAQGLYYAYLQSGDTEYLTALQDAATVMIGNTGIRSAADLIFLMNFQTISGVTPNIYQAAAKAKFDGRITAYGSATGLAEYIRDARAGSYPNGIIAWDIGAWALAAAMLDDLYPAPPSLYDYGQAAEEIAEVLWQDSFNDTPGYFDIIDDQGFDPTYSDVNFWWYTLGITGLIDAFEASGSHTEEIPTLITILNNCQYPSGAFSGSYGANTDDEDWQSTAYSVLSLASYNLATYQDAINQACYWLYATQDPVSGGWVYGSGNHYPEIGGEVASALYFGDSDPEPEISIEDPYFESCGVYKVDITVDDFNAVGAISLTLDFDDALIQYNSVVLNPAIGGSFTGVVGDKFYLAGNYDPAFSVPDGTVLLTLTFDILPAGWGQTTLLSWPDTPPEANDIAGPNGDPSYIDSFFDISWDIPDDFGVSATPTPTTCPLSSDGEIELTPTGGELPYTFDWTGPGGFTSSAQDLTGLVTGTYNLTATDASGCVETLSVLVDYIPDAIAPVITCPADVTVSCDEDTTPAGTGVATATDNCDPNPVITFSDVTVNGSCPGNYVITRTWTATDYAGKSSTCDQTITVVDNTAPDWIDPIFRRDMPLANVNNASGANRSNVSWADTDPVNYYFGDDFKLGYSEDGFWTINKMVVWGVIGDVTDPDFELEDYLNSITLYAAASSVDPWVAPFDYTNNQGNVAMNTITSGNFLAGSNNTDNADISIKEVTYYNSESYQSSSGPFKRIWQVTFDNLNWTVPSEQLIVYGVNCDHKFPTETTKLWYNHYSNYDNGLGSVPPWTAWDGLFLGFDHIVSSEVYALDPVLNGWWDKGNDHNVLIYGIASCGIDLNLCLDDVPAGPTAVEIAALFEDNCSDPVTATKSTVTTGDNCGWNVMYVYDVVDACGNMKLPKPTVNYNGWDQTDPVITCPADVTINCEDDNTPAGTGYATATDYCDPEPVITFEDVVIDGTCPGDYEIIRTWTATDDCDNTSTCDQTITVVDVTPPDITCPDDVTIECEASVDPTNTGMAIATDLCDPDPDITYVDVVISGCYPGDYVFERTWTAEDECGNSSSCVQTITVNDNVPPVISCPPDITVCGPQDVSWTTEVADITEIHCAAPNQVSGNSYYWIDNDDWVFQTFQPNNTGVLKSVSFGLMDIARPFTVTVSLHAGEPDCSIGAKYPEGCPMWTGSLEFPDDGSPNADGIYTIQVPENEKPFMFAGGGMYTLTFEGIGQQDDTWTHGWWLSYPNCDPIPSSYNDPMPGGGVFGCTNCTYCYTDLHLAFNTVMDVIPGLTVSDNCGLKTVVSDIASGTYFSVGSTSVTYTATDFGGNTAQCSFNINVNPIPVLSAVSLQASIDDPVGPYDYLVSGDLGGGYEICLVPEVGNYYLDVDALSATPGLLSDFLNPFYLSGTYSQSFFDYWADPPRNVTEAYAIANPDSWQAQMWEIINGNQPFFYIKLTLGVDYILVDGLQYWAAQQPTPTLGAEPILQVPGDYPNDVYTYVGDITDENNCVSDPIAVVMSFNACDLTGVLTYYNTALTGLSSVTITLNSTPPRFVNTAPDGSYTLLDVPSGTHTITVNENGKTSGGVNATDAAQVNAWGVGPQYPIEMVRFLAGDANLPYFDITSADPQKILTHFVTGGTNGSSPMAIPWKFWIPTLTSANPYTGPALPSVTVGSSSVSQNLYGLCTGDFNRSYSGASKGDSESLVLKSGKQIFAEVGSELELPITIGMDMDLGAASLILNYPADKIEVDEVFFTADPTSPLMYNVSGDEIRIGWTTIVPVYLTEGACLITLKVKVIEESGPEGINFTLASNPLNELANANYVVIDDAVLVVDVIQTSALGIINNTADRLELENHPNPFHGTTTFEYSIPVEGRVILEVYDLVGNKVMTAVDEVQGAGKYAYKVDANILQPGVYTATLKVLNKNDKLIKAIKIVSR